MAQSGLAQLKVPTVENFAALHTVAKKEIETTSIASNFIKSPELKNEINNQLESWKRIWACCELIKEANELSFKAEASADLTSINDLLEKAKTKLNQATLLQNVLNNEQINTQIVTLTSRLQELVEASTKINSALENFTNSLYLNYPNNVTTVKADFDQFKEQCLFKNAFRSQLENISADIKLMSDYAGQYESIEKALDGFRELKPKNRKELDKGFKEIQSLLNFNGSFNQSLLQTAHSVRINFTYEPTLKQIYEEFAKEIEKKESEFKAPLVAQLTEFFNLINKPHQGKDESTYSYCYYLIQLHLIRNKIKSHEQVNGQVSDDTKIIANVDTFFKGLKKLEFTKDESDTLAYLNGTKTFQWNLTLTAIAKEIANTIVFSQDMTQLNDPLKKLQEREGDISKIPVGLQHILFTYYTKAFEQDKDMKSALESLEGKVIFMPNINKGKVKFGRWAWDLWINHHLLALLNNLNQLDSAKFGDHFDYLCFLIDSLLKLEENRVDPFKVQQRKIFKMLNGPAMIEKLKEKLAQYLKTKREEETSKTEKIFKEIKIDPKNKQLLLACQELINSELEALKRFEALATCESINKRDKKDNNSPNKIESFESLKNQLTVTHAKSQVFIKQLSKTITNNKITEENLQNFVTDLGNIFSSPEFTAYAKNLAQFPKVTEEFRAKINAQLNSADARAHFAKYKLADQNCNYDSLIANVFQRGPRWKLLATEISKHLPKEAGDALVTASSYGVILTNYYETINAAR